MRIRGMVVAGLAVALVGVSATAVSGATREVTDRTGPTRHLSEGGTFVAKVREVSGDKIRVVVTLRLDVRRSTRVAVYVYPCRDSSCRNRTSGRVALGPGRRSVRFSGLVPAVRETVDGQETDKACVFVRAVDLGAAGERARQIKLRRRGAGAVICMRMGRWPRPRPSP